MKEEDIIKGCIKQDPASQRLLFDQYAGKMMGLCQRYGRDQQESQDFLQLGFIQIFEHIRQYKGTGSFEGWMRKIFVRIALRQIAKWKLDFSDINRMDDDVASEMPGVLSKITEDEIHQLIRRLPDGYRVVFNLHVIEGYSHEEIADMLKIKQATSRTQLLKARKMLQTFIAHRYNHSSV